MSNVFFRFTRLSAKLAAEASHHRRAIQFVAVVAALGLGLWGWTRHNPPHGDPGKWLENIIHTAQLITFQFPSAFDRNVPLPLQFARLLVPAAAALATFNVLVSAVTRPFRLAMMPRVSNHAIVIGDGKFDEGAMRKLAERGSQVFIVGKSIGMRRREAFEGMGHTVIDADPALPLTYQAINVVAARTLLICADTDADTLSFTTQAIGAAAKRLATQPPLLLAALFEREDLGAELGLALDSLARAQNVRFHRLCPERDSLRRALATRAPVFAKPSPQKRSHVLVVGLAGGWTQALSELIATVQDHPDLSARLTFALDDGEAEKLADWRRRRPELESLVEFRRIAATVDATAPAEWLHEDLIPQLVVIMREDADGLSTALELSRPGGGSGLDRAGFLVRRAANDRVVEMLSRTTLRERDLSNIVAFGPHVDEQEIGRLIDREGDDIAIAVHARYLDRGEQARGAAAALKAWDDLTEGLRDANRASAAHAPILFASAGYRLTKADAASKAGLTPAPAFDALTLERLARVEHRRWCADRIDKGWRHGAERRDPRRMHPSLVPYDQLHDAEREKDRAAVRGLREVFEKEGYALVRAGAIGYV